jgi:hypothetical protein
LGGLGAELRAQHLAAEGHVPAPPRMATG